MSPTVICRATVADAPALAKLAAHTFAETFAADNKPEDIENHLGSAYGLAQQTSEIQDPEVITLLAHREEVLVGFAQVRRKATPSCVIGERPVELHRFYVLRSLHGTGLGASLMQAVHAAAQELGGHRIWLGVWERNARALAFYRKAGFVEVGKHVFMVGSDPQTDLVLVSPLLAQQDSAAQPPRPSAESTAGRMKTLRSARCTLEPQVQAHAAEMFLALSDPAIYEYEGVPPPSMEKLANGFQRKESRVSPDGLERWLNWVVRLPSGELCGYVQATVYASGAAYIAYEFASKHWRQGIGSSAVLCMLDDLRDSFSVHTFVAVLKAKNHRSHALLVKLGFKPGTKEDAVLYEAESDEITLVMPARPAGVAHTRSDSA